MSEPTLTINVRFFASLRENLGVESLAVNLPDGSSAGDLLRQLAAKAEEEPNQAWSALNGERPVMIAVNQTMAQPSTALRDQDEVALFPPVTGG